MARFSTKDQDNDRSERNCAEDLEGGWWFKDCSESNLNGEYLDGSTKKKYDGMFWSSWRGYEYSVSKVRMMVREHGVDLDIYRK